MSEDTRRRIWAAEQWGRRTLRRVDRVYGPVLGALALLFTIGLVAHLRAGG